MSTPATAVYGGFTAEELDRQYNNRAAVPRHPEIIDSWRARSEAWRRRADARLDLAYGETGRERLDLFLCGRAGAPLHLFVHGGYWQGLDRSLFGFLAEPLVERGAHVAVAGYPLCPDATLGAIVAALRRAVIWLHRHAAGHGAAAERIQVSGHSAGGHLAAMLMATDWPALGAHADAPLPADLIESGVPVSGLFELEPLRFTYVNEAVRMDAETALRLSPTRLAPASRAPLVVAVGSAESDEYHRQSAEFAHAWRAHGVPVDLRVLPGHDHFTIVEELAHADGALVRAAAELLGL